MSLSDEITQVMALAVKARDERVAHPFKLIIKDYRSALDKALALLERFDPDAAERIHDELVRDLCLTCAFIK